MDLTKEQERIVKNLSPSMLKGLRIASDGGLTRFPGGFWISGNVRAKADRLGSPVVEGTAEKVPHVSAHTIQSLKSRGLVEQQDLEHDSPSWGRRRLLRCLLTDFGWEAFFRRFGS